ncbi:hypothetical protein OSB04_027387 [Centaurea solstitialis]|uniref:Voltage-dependent anion-selective channel protein n=1 Tax=Centaurea solstitialis TaxID=347529 RepID=A0AA38SQR9_9ASTR|nr:hypothetical protein OSB04_027387 [Centaurea solstitialis]
MKMQLKLKSGRDNTRAKMKKNRRRSSSSSSSSTCSSSSSMNRGPGLFSDIGRKAKDLLSKDYLLNQRLSVSTTTATGVTITSSATKKGGVSTGDVGASYKFGETSLDVKFNTKSNIAATLTLTNSTPSTSTTASFNLPDYTSSMTLQYFHSHATLTSAVALNPNPTIDLSATIGTPTFAIGAEAGYERRKRSSSKLTNYAAGISVNKPNYSASILLGDKGDTINASYMHRFDLAKKTTAAVMEISRRLSTSKNTFIVGGSYAVDGLTVVKAKLDNHGKLDALLQHEFIPKSFVTLSTQFHTKALHKTPKFGLALALKPQSKSRISTAKPSSLTNWCASNCCSAYIGHVAIGTPYQRLSSMEFHPQWDMNPPTATWANTAVCGTHPTTLPFPAVRSRKPSGRTSL